MFSLSPDQHNAVTEIIKFLIHPKEHEMALAGPAGTGKTVLTRYILQEIDNKLEFMRMISNKMGHVNIHLTSTTNKAAKVLADATGQPTQTIHSLLKFRVIKDYDTGEKRLIKTKNTKIIENSLIIVDEASMCDEYLLNKIRKYTKDCKVLYILDPYQLAPVNSLEIPVSTSVKHQVKLTQIHRQAAGNPIIQFSEGFKHALDTDQFPQISSIGDGVYHYPYGSPMWKQAIDHYFKDFSTKDKNYSRIIAWTNKKIQRANKYVRALNGHPDKFYTGEIVLTNKPITHQDEIVFRTDSLVQITNIHPMDIEGIQGLKITLNNTLEVFQPNNWFQANAYIKQLKKQKNWKEYFAAEEFFSDLRPIYANTINKAQGSTYENVFIDLTDIGRNPQRSEIARLMYTAITRSSQKVFMHGNLPERLYK